MQVKQHTFGRFHRLRTPREEIAFTARPKIQSQSQIFRYGRGIFCLPHQPNFSDILDLCLHWVSVVRAPIHSCTFKWKCLQKIKYIFILEHPVLNGLMAFSILLLQSTNSQGILIYYRLASHSRRKIFDKFQDKKLEFLQHKKNCEHSHT